MNEEVVQYSSSPTFFNAQSCSKVEQDRKNLLKNILNFDIVGHFYKIFQKIW